MRPSIFGRGPVHTILHDDHRRLEVIFDELVQAADAGLDRRSLGELWTRFDAAVRRHLDAEEALLFPLLAARHAAELETLRAVHTDLRARLDALDLAVDLHLVRSPVVRDLVARLRAHAREEDAGLYRWAEEAAPPGPGLGDRLKDRLHPAPARDDATAEALVEALDGEYHARAAHKAVLARFGPIQPFRGVLASDERHIQALTSLVAERGRPVPADPWPARVAPPATLAEACREAIAAEREHADRCGRLGEQTEDPAVRRLLQRMREASQVRHLPALERCLDRSRRHGTPAP